MELDVWAGDWGLPSIDINCLQIMAYCKFSGAPLQVNVTSNPYKSNLPRFRHNSHTFSSLIDVVNYLQTKNINADYLLTSAEISQMEAYGEYLRERLLPALQYVWWVDRRNYEELTRPWYAKALPFPLNYYYPGRYEREAKELITVLYGSLEEDPQSVETQVYSDAVKCITMLSTRLGESQFFLGNSPTSLDALVFSYLAPLLKAPFPKATLQNHLKGCANLVAFVNRIFQKYYPTLNKEYLKQSTESKRKEPDVDFPHKRRNKFLFGLLAAASMALYALTSGILQVSIEDAEDYDDDDYYEDVKERKK